MRTLIIDTHNLLFRVAAAGGKGTSFGDAEDRAGLAMHTSFLTVYKYFKKYQPDRLIFAFEGAQNWRKAYTRVENDPTRPVVYKANRVKDPSMQPLFEMIASFKEVMTKHTAAICITHDEVECDDIIGLYCQAFNDPRHEILILSGDRDFVQLLKHPGVRLINPDDGKDRVCDDPRYFLFEKCIRGDAGDNVPSAYPRVRSTKIMEAYNDDFKRAELMNVELECPKTGQRYRVGERFKQNEILMDLEKQPADVRDRALETIVHEITNPGVYNNFFFMKFLGKYGLKKIAEAIHLYTDMLSVNSRTPSAGGVKPSDTDLLTF